MYRSDGFDVFCALNTGKQKEITSVELRIYRGRLQQLLGPKPKCLEPTSLEVWQRWRICCWSFLFPFFFTVTLQLIWNTFNTQTHKWNITWSLSGAHPWRETPTGIPQIRSGFFPCVIFPWMLSFIHQTSGRQEQRVKGAQGWVGVGGDET